MAAVYAAPAGRFVDPTRRYAQVIVAGRHDYGFPESQAFVRRLRSTLIPAARFPAAADVLVGGGPAQGVDFLHQAYRYFPPLVVAVLRAHLPAADARVPLAALPLKAVLLNLLSVGASYGMLVVVFRWGVGHDLLGLYQFGQVEGWIPIFLFAMLFGLSMDYEVFLVTRMREAWDERRRQRDGRRARARADRPDHHRGGGDHVRRVLGLRRRPDRRAAGVRARARGRDLRRRDDRPLAARAEPDGALRPLELVAPGAVARVVRVAPSPLESPARAALGPAGR